MHHLNSIARVEKSRLTVALMVTFQQTDGPNLPTCPAAGQRVIDVSMLHLMAVSILHSTDASTLCSMDALMHYYARYNCRSPYCG